MGWGILVKGTLLRGLLYFNCCVRFGEGVMRLVNSSLRIPVEKGMVANDSTGRVHITSRTN